MRPFVTAMLLAFLSGCGQSQPTLSGGKPVSHWVEVLRDGRDPKTRKEAAFKLGNVGPTDPLVLPALAESLKDADPAVRCEVILALVKCGSAAREAVPRITELRDRDRDAKVRSYACRALEKIQQE